MSLSATLAQVWGPHGILAEWLIPGLVTAGARAERDFRVGAGECLNEGGRKSGGWHKAWRLQELGARSCDRQGNGSGGRPAKFNSPLKPGFILSVCLPEVEGEDEWEFIADSEPCCVRSALEIL